MTDALHATVRSEVGSNAVKKVRKANRIPAILYGHGLENVNLSIPAEDVHAAIRHGSKLVELKGELNESALLRDVQWDGLGNDILHIDLTRVTAGETVHVTVPLAIRGDAPGSHEGGITELLIHEIEVECSASEIPDKIDVRVHELHVGDSLRASDIELPTGSKLYSDPDAIVVHCVGAAIEEEEETTAVAGAAEPEVIGRKDDEEEGED
jgi:large subunit ribosomal protein L25